MRHIYWRLIPALFFGVFVIFLWRGLSLNPHALPSTKIGQQLPDFQLSTLDKPSVLSPKTIRGHIALLNVWASWCPACTEEQVFLMQLAHDGLLIYGLNYKDQPIAARQWLQEWGNPYRLIGQDREGRVGIDLGVYGAPETFLIDQQGIIRYRHAGVLNAMVWQNEFVPRIKQLEGHQQRA